MDRGGIDRKQKFGGSTFSRPTNHILDGQGGTSFSNSVRRGLTSPSTELVRSRRAFVGVMMLMTLVQVTMNQITATAQDQ